MTYQELGQLIAEFKGPVTCHVNIIGPVHVHKADLLMILRYNFDQAAESELSLSLSYGHGELLVHSGTRREHD